MSRLSDYHAGWIQALACATLSIAVYSSLDIPQKVKQLKRGKTPRITASLKDGFCGHNDILVSRLPLGQRDMRTTSWETLLRIFHQHDASVVVQGDQLISNIKSWSSVPTQDADKSTSNPGASISRTTLISLLIMSNARIIYEYSDASGYRAALGSWTGQWYINMRAGEAATVTLRAHDSHSAATDVYPPVFPVRVDRCVQMMAGVVAGPPSNVPFSVAFPGRLAAGRYVLEYQPKGFGLSHGSRHIYNMNGGKVFEIDFLYTRPFRDATKGSRSILLYLPSVDPERTVELIVPKQEQLILAQALDSLPWANISWSIHRGMRDLLLAYSKETMDLHRHQLSLHLRDAALKFHSELVEAGWNASFARDSMGDMAASAVLAGRGNSGDAVRVVTALAEMIHRGGVAERDCTGFWRGLSEGVVGGELEPDGIVALVKGFVLEWSVEFDYQMYHQLPLDLVFV